MKPCVRSGFCCKQAPCPFGEVTSAKNSACKFLGGEKPGQHFCQKYDEIIKDKTSWISPAFGAGCGSPLNSDRVKLI